MNPSTKTKSVLKQSQHDELISHLIGGTAAFRAQGKKYLIQNPAESDRAFSNRLKVATLFPAFSSTVANLSAKPFQKPVTVADAPEELKSLLANVNLEGENLTVFASNLLFDAMAYGVSYILVDYPPAENVVTREQERAAGLRPYLCHVKKTDVLGISAARIGGRQVLTQFRYMESVTVDNGDFTESVVEQIRVLRPGVWEIWRKDSKTGDWVQVELGTTTLDYVPVVAVYGNRTGFYTGEPLLLELAHQNVKLYNSQSEQQNIVHVARVPLLAVIGPDAAFDEQGNTVQASVNSLTTLPMGGDMKWVEHSGKAIESGRQFELDIMEQMAQAHADLLQRRVVRATATEAAMDVEAQLSVLHGVVADLQDSLDNALQMMADWMRLSDGGKVSVFKDFSPLDMKLGLEALKVALEKRLISEEGAFATMQSMGFIDESLSYQGEREKMDNAAPVLVPDNILRLPSLRAIGA